MLCRLGRSDPRPTVAATLPTRPYLGSLPALTSSAGAKNKETHSFPSLSSRDGTSERILAAPIRHRCLSKSAIRSHELPKGLPTARSEPQPFRIAVWGQSQHWPDPSRTLLCQSVSVRLRVCLCSRDVESGDGTPAEHCDASGNCSQFGTVGRRETRCSLWRGHSQLEWEDAWLGGKDAFQGAKTS